MAEGTSLLRKHTGKTCIVGSNPTVSATHLKRSPGNGVFFRTKQAALTDVLVHNSGAGSTYDG